MVKIEVTKLNCQRCGHTWIPKKEEIRICPKCKSPYWDRAKGSSRESQNDNPNKDTGKSS